MNQIQDTLCRKCQHERKDNPQDWCTLTKAELKEAGVKVFGNCKNCNHPYGSHPAGIEDNLSQQLQQLSMEVKNTNARFDETNARFQKPTHDFRNSCGIHA